MKELWPTETTQIIVPGHYNFDNITGILRREGKIVRNSWHNKPSQKEVNLVIASIEAAKMLKNKGH